MAQLPLPAPLIPIQRTDGSFGFGPEVYVAGITHSGAGPNAPLGDAQLIDPMSGKPMPMINVVSNQPPSNADGRPDGTIYVQTV